MKRKTITISFGDYDEEIFERIKAEKNASALIRHLLRGYYNGEAVNTPEKAPQIVKIEPEVVPIVTENEDKKKNRKALKGIAF